MAVGTRIINRPIATASSPPGRTVHEPREYPFTRTCVVRRQWKFVILDAHILPKWHGILNFSRCALTHLPRIGLRSEGRCRVTHANNKKPNCSPEEQTTHTHRQA